MKIATYNVRNLYDAGTVISPEEGNTVNESFFNERVKYFVEKFRVLDLDIICLQEIGGEKGISLIGDTLGYNYFFAKPNSRGIRVAVLYKKELSEKIKCESVYLGDLFIPSILERGDTSSLSPLSQRRDVLVVDVDDFHGKKLRVVTFHLKSLLPEFLEGEDKENDSKSFTEAKLRSIFYKMMELRGLREFVDKSLNEEMEMILLGDFNENNNSSVLEILKSSSKEEKILWDTLTTYTGDKATHIHRGSRNTFDTILISQNMKEYFDSVRVENSELKDYSMLERGGIENIVEPDHAMVALTLK